MKKFISNHGFKILSFMMVAVMGVTMLTTGYSAAFTHKMNQKGTASFTQSGFFTGYKAQQSYFNTGSMEEITMRSKGTPRRAFCVRPGKSIPAVEKGYTITKEYSSRFIKSAIHYYYEKVKDYSGNNYKYELYLTQLAMWQIHKWGKAHPNKSPKPSDLRTAKLKSLAVNSPLAKKVTGEESKADAAFKYIFTNVDKHKEGVRAWKWTRDGCQSLVTGRYKATSHDDEDHYVTLKGKKTGVSGTLLSGCTIKIYKSNGTTAVKDVDGNALVAVTDVNGNWNTSSQPFLFETYEKENLVIKETATNVGTKVVNGTVSVPTSFWTKKVDKSKEESEVDVSNVNGSQIKNEPITTIINVTKVDEENKALSGAEITLYQSTSSGYSKVKSITTGADGKANFGSVKYTTTNYGKYMVRETKAPEGYKLGLNTKNFTINKNTPTVSYTFKNEKARDGALYIYKYDDETKMALKGAKFTLYEVDGNNEKKVTELTEVKDGYFEARELDINKDYIVKETKAPEGYKDENFSERFTLTKNGEAKEIKVYNKPYMREIELEKISSETKEGLADATYALYKDSVSDDNLIAVKNTDKDGKINFGKFMSYQKYVIKEVVAPKGYEKNTKEYVINKSEVTDKATITAEDDPIKRPIRIHKISGSNTGKSSKELGGAHFKVYDVTKIEDITKDNYQGYDYSKLEPVAEESTDEHGYFETKKLPIGVYVVVETKAPKNYTIAKPEMVEITDETVEYAEVEIIDCEFKANLIVKKVDPAGNVIKVAGAGFKIYDVTNGQYFKTNVVEQNEENVVEAESESIEKVFYTNEEGIMELDTLLPVGEYRLEEVVAPEGYKLSDKKLNFVVDDEADNFYVAEDEEIYIPLDFKDEAQVGTFEIEKLGKHVKGFSEDTGFTYDDNTPLKGAEFEIYAKGDIKAPYDSKVTLYKDGDLVDTITTKENGKATSKDLPLGTYTYKETKSPNGYFNEKKSGDFTLKYDKDKEKVTADASVVNEKQKVKLTIYKKDKDTEELLPGAVFGIYNKKDIKDKDGEVILEKDTLIEKCKSDENGHVEAGESLDYPVENYYIKELKPPKGYATNKDIFEVDLSSAVTTTDTISKEYVIYDEITKYDFSKHDITNKEEIEGASLTLTYKDEDGNEVVVDSWVSTTKEHRIQGLEVNKTYTLTEKLPPAGYVTAESIEFIVKDTGEVQTVKMYDDVTKARFNKVDKDTKELLEGANLTIVDENGEGFKNFTTSSKEGSYFEKIPIGKYTLKELKAPSGYVTAPDLEFEIKDTAEVQEFTMEDAKTVVEVSKVNETGTKNLEGATLKLVNNDNSKTVKEWTTNDKVATFEKLPLGSYTLTEVKAPEGYAIADDIKFDVKDSEEAVNVTMYDKKVTGKLTLTKIASDTKEMLEGATYTVYDKDMNEIDTLTTDSDGYADISGLDLKKNSTTFYVKEADAPSGYSVSDQTYKAVLKKTNDGKSEIVVKLGKVYDAPKHTIIPQTGVFSDNLPYTIMIICGALAILFIVLDRVDKRKKKRAALS